MFSNKEIQPNESLKLSKYSPAKRYFEKEDHISSVLSYCECPINKQELPKSLQKNGMTERKHYKYSDNLNQDHLTQDFYDKNKKKKSPNLIQQSSQIFVPQIQEKITTRTKRTYTTIQQPDLSHSNIFSGMDSDKQYRRTKISANLNKSPRLESSFDKVFPQNEENNPFIQKSGKKTFQNQYIPSISRDFSPNYCKKNRIQSIFLAKRFDESKMMDDYIYSHRVINPTLDSKSMILAENSDFSNKIKQKNDEMTQSFLNFYKKQKMKTQTYDNQMDDIVTHKFVEERSLSPLIISTNSSKNIIMGRDKKKKQGYENDSSQLQHVLSKSHYHDKDQQPSKIQPVERQNNLQDINSVLDLCHKVVNQPSLLLKLSQNEYQNNKSPIKNNFQNTISSINSQKQSTSKKERNQYRQY